MLLYFMTIARKKEIKQHISLYVTNLRAIIPLLNGDDLQELGYEPGKAFKEMLATLRDAQLDGDVHNRQEAIAFTIGRFPPQATSSS